MRDCRNQGLGSIISNKRMMETIEITDSSKAPCSQILLHMCPLEFTGDCPQVKPLTRRYVTGDTLEQNIWSGCWASF